MSGNRHMLKNSYKLIILSTLIFLVVSYGCKKEIVTTPSISYNYFPSDIGTWVEYNVDSIYHSEDDNNNDDSIYAYHFEIRELIDSTYTDIEGREIQVIKRFRRADSLSEWNLANIWTQRLNSLNAYRIEDNIAFHKLSFPIKSSITWNSNDANSLQEEICSYEYFHEPGIFNSIAFDSTVSVLEFDEDNYIMKRFSNEIYASGVGLVFKVRNELEKNNGLVVSGLEYKMVIKAFGKN